MKAPRILIIPDRPGWAWDIRSQDLIRLLGDRYDFSIAYSSIENMRAVPYHTFDLVFLYWWRQFKETEIFMRRFPKICMGISSGFELSKQYWHSFEESAQKCSAVFYQNLQLRDMVKSRMDLKMFYCKNCIDSDRFTLKTPIDPGSKKLIIGSVGNPQSGCRKGFEEIILSAVKEVPGVEANLLERNPVAQEIVSYDQMPDYYNSIDCYVCASETEGTPRPCLEAAMCGRPLITTPVGVMPELVRDGENSLLMEERSIKVLIDKLVFYRDNRSVMIEHGRKIREDAIQDWSWEKGIGTYTEMLEYALQN